MRRIIIPLFALLLGHLASEAQTIAHIRQAYADAKQFIADNGNNGMAPLDVKITFRGGAELGDDDFIDEVSELTFYFNKYRIDSTLPKRARPTSGAIILTPRAIVLRSRPMPMSTTRETSTNSRQNATRTSS